MLVLMDAVNLRERSIWSDAVAATIRAERAAAGLTQAEVVERSGLARSTHVRIEAGHRVPDVTQLGRISNALGIGLGSFMVLAESRVDAARAAGGVDPLGA